MLVTVEGSATSERDVQFLKTAFSIVLSFVSERSAVVYPVLEKAPAPSFSTDAGRVRVPEREEHPSNA